MVELNPLFQPFSKEINSFLARSSSIGYLVVLMPSIRFLSLADVGFGYIKPMPNKNQALFLKKCKFKITERKPRKKTLKA